jgi:hypothetical protein
MARPIKIGLDYFPHDTEFDNELEYIIAIHKETGYYVYFRLLERLYNVFGYYYPADKKSLALLSNKINVTINRINAIINDCLDEHLFDKRLHKEYEILTSRGIQKRFFDAIGRRKECEIIKEYIILDSEYINSINVTINWINDNKSTQRKGKETKGEETKKKESIIFDESRKLYPGIKRGLDTEFEYFKKHKDWKKCLELLEPAINNQIRLREQIKAQNKFVPEWKHFKTWIYNRCWEEQITLIDDSKSEVDAALNKW